jgi:hypothetical protein
MVVLGLWCWVKVLSTSRLCLCSALASSHELCPLVWPDCGMFSYALLKAHFRDGLFAYWVSGTNKCDDSTESTVITGARGCKHRREGDERGTAALLSAGVWILIGWPVRWVFVRLVRS